MWWWWMLQTGPPALPRGVALDALVPVPVFKTQCGQGVGLVACPALDLLVTSCEGNNTLSVWGVPGGACGGSGASGGAGASAGASVGGGLTLVCTLGVAGSAAPMQFKFSGGGGGRLAFTSPSSHGTSRPLLLVTDGGHDAVHLVDAVGWTHAGYVASPGSIAGPRGVAASGTSPLVAVSAWKKSGSGDHVVVVYRGSHGGAVWEAVRVIGGELGGPGSGDGQLHRPYGLRFSGDGSTVCVADPCNGRASVFRVDDGGFVGHIATGLDSPRDVEEVEGGWLVACWASHSVEFVQMALVAPLCLVFGRTRRVLPTPASMAIPTTWPAAHITPCYNCSPLPPGCGLTVAPLGDTRRHTG